MMTHISVLLVDDHVLLLETLISRLEREQDIAVVGHAGNAEKAIELTNVHRPQIIVMDIDMPGLLCFDAAQTIGAMHPKTHLIFLSGYTHDRYIQQALSVKARGYITKREPVEHVVTAIRRVASGRTYFSREIQARLVLDQNEVRLASPPSTRSQTLTNRELEVLRYIATGMSKKDMAMTMHLSIKTVENHSAHIMDKLDIHDRVELARFAIREGIAPI